MQTKNEVKTADDLKTHASDFIMTHKKDEKFLDHYLVEAHVLGEGSFG